MGEEPSAYNTAGSTKSLRNLARAQCYVHNNASCKMRFSTHNIKLGVLSRLNLIVLKGAGMRHSTYYIAVLFVLLMLSGIGIAQEVNVEQKKVGFSDLTFKISTPKKEYLLLEPIPIQMELTNNHDKEIVGRVRMNFHQDYIRLITYHNNARTEFDSLSHLHLTDCVAYVQVPKFAPKASVRERQLLTYQLDVIFPVPGEYQVQLILENRYPTTGKAETVISDKMSVKIIQPQGSEATAYAFYSDPALQDFMQGKMEYTNQEEIQTSLRKAREFLESFSESVYHQWVKEFFMEHYDAWKATPYVTDEERSMYEKLKASR